MSDNPYSVVNLKQVDDMAVKFGLSPNLESRFARGPLELEKSGLSYFRLAPGFRLPFGHRHEQQEEIYLVVSGSVRMKLDDEIVEVEEWDAVRVPPGTWRGYEAGPEGLELLVIGAPSLGEGRRDDVEGERDWWTD